MQKGFLIVLLIFLIGCGGAYDERGRNFGFQRGPCGYPYEAPEPVPGPEGHPGYIQILSFDPQDRRALSEMAEVKALGANTIILYVDPVIKGDTAVDYSRCIEEVAEVIYGQIINAAHEEGLFVEMRVTQAPPEFEVTINTTEEAITAYTAYLERMATIAETYDVYQFTSFGEADTGFAMAHVEELQWGELDTAELSLFVQSSQETIRKHYSGRVGVGFGDVPLHATTTNISGFDYLQFSYYPQPDDYTLEEYFAGLPAMLSESRAVADAAGIPQLIWGENGVRPEDQRPIPEALEWSTLDADVETQLYYYEKIFNESQGQLDGMIIDWSGFFGIRGRPTEAIVQKWYAQN